MPTIPELGFQRITNESLNGFMALIVAILLKDPSIEAESAAKLQAAQQAFQTAIRKKNHLMSENLGEIDHNVDQTWRGTRNHLKANINNPDEEIRTAAQEVFAVFSDLPDPTKRPQAEEYGALKALIEKLEAFGEEKLRKALVLSWVKGLREGVEAFMRLKAQKTEHKSDQVLGETKQLRKSLIDTYNYIIERLNSVMFLFPDEPHQRLCDLIIQAINDQRLSAKMGKRKGEKGDEEAMED